MSETVRHNFSPSTKRLLAEQAGYCCSAPNCSKPTIAANFDSDASAGDGIASHIVSASPDSGPRANPKYTKEQRESPDNGIWLCSTHAKIIDADEVRYNVELLKRWKTDHCRKMAYKVSGQWVGNGIVAQMSLENIGRFPNKEHISFGQNTLIVGANATGKTMIFDMIAGLESRTYLEEWGKTEHENPGLVRIETFSSTLRQWEINISKEVNCKLNGQIIPSIVSGFRVIYGKNRFYPPSVDRENDTEEKIYLDELKAIAHHFQVTLDELIVVLKSLEFEAGYCLRGIRLKDGRLEAMTGNNAPWLPFRGLSSGEKQILLVEVIFRIARYHSQTAPTVLLLDEGFIGSLDHKCIHVMLDYINSGVLNCQTVINLCTWDWLNAPEWRVWQLEGESCKRTQVKIVALELTGKATAKQS